MYHFLNYYTYFNCSNVNIFIITHFNHNFFCFFIFSHKKTQCHFIDITYLIFYNIFITNVGHAPISTNEITDRLVKTTTWSPKTIQTLIKRLVTKGVLTYEKQSRVFVYTPLVGEDEYIGQESNSFLNRFYGGNISAMLSAYIDHDKLSETEINTLRSLLSKDSDKGGT